MTGSEAKRVCCAAFHAGLGALFIAQIAQASFNGLAGLSTYQYALEPQPEGRVDLGIHWASETDGEPTPLPDREVRAQGFFETGSFGDHSLDASTVVVRLPTGESSHFFLGRSQPLAEADAGYEVMPTSAIGNRWVQDQSDALAPTVDGWIGAGWSGEVALARDSALKLAVMVSPLFLPDFGPRLDLSESSDAGGSRFARLPPATVLLNDQISLPLRYRLAVGDLKRIVLQPQAFASAAWSTPRAGQFRLLAWSAPDPNPSVSATGVLQVRAMGLGANESDTTNVLVTATPYFPRRDFWGTQWRGQALPLEPELEALYESLSGDLTVSAQLSPWEYLRIGYLHTVPGPVLQSSEPTLITPRYADHLAWIQLTIAREDWDLTPSLRIEQQLAAPGGSRWVEPALAYRLRRNFQAFFALSLISGDDLSYFGAWRALDSVSTGLRCLW